MVFSPVFFSRRFFDLRVLSGCSILNVPLRTSPLVGHSSDPSRGPLMAPSVSLSDGLSLSSEPCDPRSPLYPLSGGPSFVHSLTFKHARVVPVETSLLPLPASILCRGSLRNLRFLFFSQSILVFSLCALLCFLPIGGLYSYPHEIFVTWRPFQKKNSLLPYVLCPLSPVLFVIFNAFWSVLTMPFLKDSPCTAAPITLSLTDGPMHDLVIPLFSGSPYTLVRLRPNIFSSPWQV